MVAFSTLRPNAVVVDGPHVLARRRECVIICSAAVVLDLCFAAMTVSPTTIVRRRVQIDFGTVPPGPWFPAGGWIEVVFNAASISFPLAERFGIDALRDCRARIQDPKLLKEIGGFLHQEAMHDRVHTACNDMLARHNPRVIRAERVSARIFRLLSRTPLAFRLSVSAGMEHVAFGSDYDGWVPSIPNDQRDCRDIWRIVAVLLDRGWTEAQLDRLLSRNAREVLSGERAGQLARASTRSP